MDDLLDRLRTQVERATVPIDPSEVRASGGPRRSRLLNIAAVSALLALVVGVVAIRSEHPDGGRSSISERSAVSVERIEVHSSPDGSQEVAIVFDGRLPDDRVSYVEDITSIHTPGLGYAVQGPSGLHVCQYVHWFGEGATGSIDVLIPSEWFAPGTKVDQFVPQYDPPVGVEGVDHPGKIVACGPYHGYVQYSIWGPASDEPSDVRVSVDGDSTRVVVEIDSSGR